MLVYSNLKQHTMFILFYFTVSCFKLSIHARDTFFSPITDQASKSKERKARETSAHKLGLLCVVIRKLQLLELPVYPRNFTNSLTESFNGLLKLFIGHLTLHDAITK